MFQRVSYKRKIREKKIFFFAFLKSDPELDPDPEPHLLITDTDPHQKVTDPQRWL